MVVRFRLAMWLGPFEFGSTTVFGEEDHGILPTGALVQFVKEIFVPFEIPPGFVNRIVGKSLSGCARHSSDPFPPFCIAVLP